MTYFFVYLSVVLCIARGLPVIAEFVHAQKNDILRRPGKTAMKLAIFDIDGTLVEGSTERRFWRYLLKRGHQGPRQVVAYLLFWLRFFPVFGRLTREEEQGVSLQARRPRACARWLRASSPRRFLPRLYAPAVQRLQSHLRRGDTVVLLSGTLEPIARALASALGVAHVRATLCRERDGRYLAAARVHPFGAAKLELAAQFAAEIGATLSEASAYGDSQHDLDLLAGRRRPRRGDAGSAAARDGARQPLAHHREPQRAARPAAIAARLTCRRAGCSRRGRTARCDCALGAWPCRAPCRRL